MVIKENIATSDVEIDKTDSSITRTHGHFLELFEKAELSIYKKLNQHHFPKALYTVYMFVLRPAVKKSENSV